MTELINPMLKDTQSTILTQYPEFERVVKLDKANVDFVHTSCFPDKRVETKISA